MAVRLLVMFSLMLLEAGLGIAGIIGVVSIYSPYEIREAGIAGIVMLSVGIAIFWLLTIAFFIRKSSREKAARIVADARKEAAAILADATEKALALCSLEGGKCRQCGNPRTGKFCPKCGADGDALASSNRDGSRLTAPGVPTPQQVLAAT
jgi:hypothetical protein